MRDTPIVSLKGHLTREALDSVLDDLDLDPEHTPAVIVDCSAMESYDADARERFVDWHRAHRARIGAVLIVTDKPLWQLVISAMALASKQTMVAFDDLASAKRWIQRRG